MAKRGADKYLTDSNWDKDDDEESEERGNFAAASDDVLSKRTMLKAKRRTNAADSTNSNSLANFAGFTSHAGGTDTKPLFQFATSQAADSETCDFPVLPECEAKTSENMTKLNKQLLKWATEETSKHTGCDLTPGLVKYVDFVNKINNKSVNGASLSSASTASKTSTGSPESTVSTNNAVPLSELFKKSSDTWDCPACFVNNKNSSDSCVSCTSARPKSVASKIQAAPDTSSEVSASTQPSLSELFKKSSSEWECASCWVRNKSTEDKCVACGEKAPKKTSGATESAAASSASVTETTTTGFSFAPQGGFTFNFSGAGTGGTPFRFNTINTSSSTTNTTTGQFNFGSFAFKPPAETSSGTTTQTASTSSFSFGTGSNVAGASLFGQGFGSKSSESGAADNKDEDENEEYVPPKPETAACTESDAFYTVRCKLFYQIDGAWQDRGVGNLFLKPCGERTQILIRTDTSLGNILLNIYLIPSMPVSRQGANNVSLMCVPNPPIVDMNKKQKRDPDQMVATLIRVKSGELADELLAKITECKLKKAE